MAKIASIGLCTPPYRITQEKTIEIVRELFRDSFNEIERLLKVFENGQIKERYFTVPLDWFIKDHSFMEKNDLFIEKAVQFGKAAIRSCLEDPVCLRERVPYEEIDAIFFITSSGISTPTIDAKIMNELPFHEHCKRIPIWGLGCAGGASGLSRAFEYCKAYPKAKVLVLSVELCSLTFQKNDMSKSNLVGTSLFADGIACALVCGDEVDLNKEDHRFLPKIKATQSTLMPNSEDIMGWKIRNEGFYVIFSKDIPSIIRKWLGPNVNKFLEKQHVRIEQIEHFVAHPGGRKVLEAYVDALQLDVDKIKIPLKVLENYGNMSSATIFYVLKQFLEKNCKKGEYGLLTALGPGFSSELLLLKWE
ncbi:type III polyketide synthase [Calidifontibacillus erzurumensis]|uniref:Type III polyketide synthase n=1 Tax=Calidifontibacillus erzurumensis TaxID=2741433 RepID=A0A8J8GHX3_9BACI|nr:3-oxoacyl-[acyl-carrier-protein] synthase III C-terminal domain-containing protein [Calidifontibacillus erzurumensis]NSL52655.1 type III polyketide synthase [Calidifontibacillus erzurumensis]